MTKKKSRKHRKSHRRHTNKARGRTPPASSPTGLVNCCMCNQPFSRNETLVPARCLKEHGDRAHRICQECWWNTFAKEDAPHGCPGCIHNIPLPPALKSTRKPTTEEIFVISD